MGKYVTVLLDHDQDIGSTFGQWNLPLQSMLFANFIDTNQPVISDADALMLHMGTYLDRSSEDKNVRTEELTFDLSSENEDRLLVLDSFSDIQALPRTAGDQIDWDAIQDAGWLGIKDNTNILFGFNANLVFDSSEISYDSFEPVQNYVHDQDVLKYTKFFSVDELTNGSLDLTDKGVFARQVKELKGVEVDYDYTIEKQEKTEPSQENTEQNKEKEEKDVEQDQEERNDSKKQFSVKTVLALYNKDRASLKAAIADHKEAMSIYQKQISNLEDDIKSLENNASVDKQPLEQLRKNLDTAKEFADKEEASITGLVNQLDAMPSPTSFYALTLSTGVSHGIKATFLSIEMTVANVLQAGKSKVRDIAENVKDHAKEQTGNAKSSVDNARMKVAENFAENKIQRLEKKINTDFLDIKDAHDKLAKLEARKRELEKNIQDRSLIKYSSKHKSADWLAYYMDSHNMSDSEKKVELFERAGQYKDGASPEDIQAFKNSGVNRFLNFALNRIEADIKGWEKTYENSLQTFHRHENELNNYLNPQNSYHTQLKDAQTLNEQLGDRANNAKSESLVQDAKDFMSQKDKELEDLTQDRE